MMKSHGFYLLKLFLVPVLIWSLRRQGDTQHNETENTEQNGGVQPAPTLLTNNETASTEQKAEMLRDSWAEDVQKDETASTEQQGGAQPTSTPTSIAHSRFPPTAVPVMGPRDTPSCFPPTALVRIADPMALSSIKDAERPLADLRTGERLLSETGHSNTFVLDFHESVPDRKTSLTKYLRIEHALQKHGRPLLVTANHLVFVVTGAQQAAQAMPASEIRPGHVVLVFSSDASRDSGKLIESHVTSVGSVVLRGFAAPLSTSGTLFVEDVLVSSYALLSDAQLALWQRGPAILRENTHSICHMLAWPFRWAHALGWGSGYLSALSVSFDALSVGVRLFSSSIA
eukprot:TRINITY_DN5927_c0_g1_i8.p1 TRINITY_DN5927_c0_g1~~TRINITY_DN5927_c0_g1_i8.p1  ORF type:complete len:362 (-),score=26.89 TRINITY_DN5927_c0_g1_i8:168-1196(-)